MSMKNRPSGQQAFTLIELMITLVVAAILMGIAIPSFQGFITKNRADTLQGRLASALATARSESAARSTRVALCPSDDGVDCGGSWTDGWLVFENMGATATDRDNTEEIIEYFANDVGYTLRALDGSDGTTALSIIEFNSQGFLRTPDSALLTVCEPDKDLAYARGLYVNASGLIIKTADNHNAAGNPGSDGVQDWMKAGTTVTALSCP